MIAAQERERRALARELHDEVGQVLGAVNLNLQTVRPRVPPEAADAVDDCIAVVAAAIRQVRCLSLALRPPMLDDFGLAAALRWYLDQRAGVAVTLGAPDDVPRAPAEVEAACHRVVQEAVANALKHGHPRHVRARLDPGPAELAAEVRDDGAGFDPPARGLAGPGSGFGLGGMRERAELLGGTFDVASVPAAGTTVRVRIPLPSTPTPVETGP